MTKPGSRRIVYLPLVVRHDIPNLDAKVAKSLKSAIERKLGTRPEIYGTPLRGTIKGYWKLRAGDWRVVYLITISEVIICLIAHRREAYRLAERRLA